ncbi:MAG TPA: bifunctional aspartate kinase/homoserine dehydrogenase I [Candidatus Saccharimonadia bacterium]|nr:bifunctional aspartate kinase/homoserine dehydrogenase I [Candidatus Saccharimonadia bacterium]
MSIAIPQAANRSEAHRVATTWVAHKFGGTSMADMSRMRHVAQLLAARAGEPHVVVVSAMKGVTDALIALAEAAAVPGGDWRERMESLRTRHLDAARALPGEHGAGAVAWIEREFADLADVLHATGLLGSASNEMLEFVQGLGEVWSSRLLALLFASLGERVDWLDAREVLVVRREPYGIAVDWDASRANLARWRAAHPATRIVASGFVARDPKGRATVLGRNGSDYSGAIFGSLFDACAIEIWTDVDGVLSADPRLVPEAVLLDRISYTEACELAYFGAKVVHPQTMGPAIARGIPLRIRNTFNPGHPGTLIEAQSDPTHPVKGFSTIDGLALVSVEGTGLIGVPGTAERLFGALHRADVSVVMISQGSSEHSICCVVQASVAARAVEVLEEAWSRELARGQIERVVADTGVSVLALVGDGMAGMPGVAARLFAALARARVNVRAIAQGASERNISVAISSIDASRALRAAHAGFFLSPQTLSVGIVGPGQVGRALLAQIDSARERLERDTRLVLRVRAIADSRHMLLAERELALGGWRAALDASHDPADLEAFAEHVRAPHLPHAVIVDASASDAVASHYPKWLAAGIHVVTPNKHAGSGPMPRYRALQGGSGRFRYEATVGAGLPIITTLRDLVDTGDEVLAIEGMLSGTLAYLFHDLHGDAPFSQRVAAARGLGYTEPDPRDDLSGTDVARKLVILGRELGLGLEVADVEVENLVPPALREVSRDEFLARLPELDDALRARLAAARAQGKALRHVAHLTREGTARVGLVELEPSHPFANARPTDNVVQFTSRRYRENPLVVQGPGAGPEVTAAGVFADLLRIGTALGARI